MTTPVIRLFAAFLAAATVLHVSAAHKPAPARAQAAIVAPAVDKNGDPILQSSGVLVLDANTGNTLYSKNAHPPAPTPSTTRWRTARVVTFAKRPLAEALQISNADRAPINNAKPRLPT